MKQHYVMGIDNGGTVTKAAIYDRAGNVVASASKSTQMLTPKEFHTERDINELWAANVEVIKTALAQSGIDASQIKGVAVTGHGNGLYMVDETGARCATGSFPPIAGLRPGLKSGTATRRLSATFCPKLCSLSGPGSPSPSSPG